MQRLLNILRWIRTEALKVNLFETVEAEQDPIELRISLISTRIYIILQSLILINLGIYASVIVLTRSTTIKSPSEKSYMELYKQYPTTLTCPCSNIVSHYYEMVNITVQYHPACRSHFVTNEWMYNLFVSNSSGFDSKNIRLTFDIYFQLLKSFCNLTKKSVENSIDEIVSSVLVTNDLIANSTLINQIQEDVQFSLNTTGNTIHQHHMLSRETIHSNQYETGFQVPKEIAYIWTKPGFSINKKQFSSTIIDTGNGTSCSCVDQSTCTTNHILIYTNRTTVNTGFRTGCYIVESFLQSDLRCLFSSDCIQALNELTPNMNESFNRTQALNIAQTRFLPETNVSKLVEELFIDVQLINVSFSNYYKLCKPLSCTYIYTQTGSALLVVTVLSGMFGGFTVVVRLIIFQIVRILYHKWLTKKTAASKKSCVDMSFFYQIKRAWNSIMTYFWELNLFETPISSTDLYEANTGRITTRVYLFSLLVSIIIILFYAAIDARLVSKTVINPSQASFEFLNEKYPNKLHCPCTVIKMPYGDIVEVTPTFHSACSSWLLSDDWIQYLTDVYSNRNTGPKDIRSNAPGIFNALKTLCILANTTFINSWHVVSHSLMYTDEVLSERDFLTRVNATITLFKTRTVAKFRIGFGVIDLLTQDMLIAENGNVDLSFTLEQNAQRYLGSYYATPTVKDKCTCQFDDTCSSPIYYYFDYLHVQSRFLWMPGFYSGCSSIYSVRLSTLECFYNSTCLNQTIQSLAQNFQAPTFETNVLSMNHTRFFPKMNMSDAIDNLLIDVWNVNIKYSEYYKTCNPSYCLYTYTMRGELSYVVTTILGIFGGITVFLRVTINFIVRFVRNRFKQRSIIDKNKGSINIKEYIKNAWSWVTIQLLTLNLFETKLSWNDNERQRREIITTRCYLLILIACIILASIYAGSLYNTRIFTILDISEAKFDQLNSNARYSTTLDCPCQNFTVSLDRFISISPQLHEICTSSFVVKNSDWVNHFLNYSLSIKNKYNQYWRFIVPHFRGLAALCHIVQITIEDSLSTFLSTRLITRRIESIQAINSRIDSLVNQFQHTTINEFNTAITTIEDLIEGNRLMTSIFSNWKINDLNIPTTPLVYFRYFQPAILSTRSYENLTCMCDSNPKCTEQAKINGSSVPGFRIGCYPIESLFQSTLECLYNVSCIKLIRSTVNGNDSDDFQPLNSSVESKSITVKTLMDSLMIEQWHITTRYDEYFKECASSFCTYSITTRFDSTYVFTTIMGISGGLSVLLKTAIPISVKAFNRMLLYRRNKKRTHFMNVHDIELK